MNQQETKILITEELNSIFYHARTDAIGKKIKYLTIPIVAKYLFKSSPFVSLLINKGVLWDSINKIQEEVEDYLNNWDYLLTLTDNEKNEIINKMHSNNASYFKNETNFKLDNQLINYAILSSPMLERVDRKSTDFFIKKNVILHPGVYLYFILNESNCVIKNICQKHGIDSDKIEDLLELNLDKQSTTFIDEYTINLNNKNNNTLNLFRKSELNLIYDTLNRKENNNVVLVGEGGVGKTNLLYDFATQVKNKTCPSFLFDYDVLLLNNLLLLASSKYRGEIEERFDALIAELSTSKKNIILAIDDLGLVLNNISGYDLTLSFKTLLSNPKIKLISTISFDLHRKLVEKDSTILRKLLKIELLELTSEQTYNVLFLLKERFNKDYSVKLTNDNLNYVIKMSKQFLAKKTFPDKAIDLLEQVCSKANINNLIYIDESFINTVVSALTKISLFDLKNDEKIKIKELKEKLASKVFGQNHAIDKIYSSLLVSKTGLRDSNKPISNLLFTGPTGVGKTELAIQLSKHLGINFVRFDMSEFMESHTVSKLIGAPPGYIGYDKGGELTELVEKNPYCVLLLDEIEKAHPDIYNILLQVMDNGSLTDGQGRKVDFNNVILILTSNLGAVVSETQTVGIVDNKILLKNKRTKEINNFFRPEFLNRLDGIIEFNKITKDISNQIVGKNLNELSTLLKDKHIELTFSAAVVDYLVSVSFDEKYGARPLNRVIETQIKSKIADILINKNDDFQTNVFLDVLNDEFIFISNNKRS